MKNSPQYRATAEIRTQNLPHSMIKDKNSHSNLWGHIVGHFVYTSKLDININKINLQYI